MQKRRKIIIFCIIVIHSILMIEIGLLISRDKYFQFVKSKINSLEHLHSQTVSGLNDELRSNKDSLSQLKSDKHNLSSEIDKLSEQINRMRGSVAGVNDFKYPFAVPSVGVVGSQQSTYSGEHYGIDIWTWWKDGGAISSHRGNPVYSACDGVVYSFQEGNGGVTISCDEIPEYYNVPERKVYTYYGHLGNTETSELYITVKRGDRVKKGQFIGFQGDLSQFTPGMRNVHLHFSVFKGPREKDGSQNPCTYIGGECNTVGYFFINGN